MNGFSSVIGFGLDCVCTDSGGERITAHTISCFFVFHALVLVIDFHALVLAE